MPVLYKKNIISLVLCCCAFIAFAQQDIKFEHVSEKYTFSSSVIRDLIQDQYGFIWICTEDGLDRFDGYENVSFKHHPDDSTSISSGWIFKVFEDRDGHIWVGTKRGLNLLNRETGFFQRFMEYRSNNRIVKLDNINKIFQDTKGNLWFGGKSLHRLDLDNMSFKEYPIFKGLSLEEKLVNFIDEDENGRLLVGTYLELLYLDQTKDEFRPLEFVEQKFKKAIYHARGMLQDRQGYIWIIGNRDLLKLDLNRESLDTIASNIITQVDYVIARDLVEDQYGGIWFGKTSTGLKRVDSKTNEILSFQYNPLNRHSLKDGIGEWLLFDQQGSLWVGGENGLDRLAAKFVNGLNELENSMPFLHYQAATNGNVSENSKMVRAFLKDKQENFWVATYEGLFQYRQRGLEMILIRHFSTTNPKSTISSNAVRDLLEDRNGNIWVATRAGLNKIDPQTWEVEHILFDALPNNLSEEVFWSLCEDNNGSLWIGTQGNGLLYFDPSNGQTKRFVHNSKDKTSISANEVLDVFHDSQGRIWVGTLGGGLNLYSAEKESFLRATPNFTNPQSISGDIIWAIFEDSQNRLWIGTQNGLNLLIQNTKDGEDEFVFRKYLEEDGLINNTIHGILEDDQKRLWISTIKGISCFFPEEDKFLNFGVEDGLEAKNFNPHAYLKDPYTGEFYFGGTNGYNRFRPQYIQADDFAPAVEISSGIHFNSNDNDGRPIVDPFISKGEKLIFSHKDDIIAFDVTLMNFNSTLENQYKYILEGVNTNWVPLGTNRKITFTNLDIGSYTLKVIGANQDGVWSNKETVVHFEVIPPWWWTSFAKIVYFTIVVLLVVAIYRYLLNRKLIEKEAQQLKEMDELKSHFFTNISHEFRTPLTIISGMANQIRENPDRWMEKGLDLIHRNSSQLLLLINQILDLRKLESGKLKPKFVNGNVVSFLQYLGESFSSMADAKHIKIHFLASKSDINLDFDPEKMTQVFSNLLSNAIKYTEGPGDIYLHLDRYEIDGEAFLKAEVKDTGKGIAKESLPFIFDRFYQVEETKEQKPQGSGIGLSLTQELVKVLGGSITVASREGKGTTFTLLFPITHQAVKWESPFQDEIIKSKFSRHANNIPTALLETKHDLLFSDSLDSELPLILVVEDNLDVQIYLKSCLESRYRLMFAENGEEGINQALEYIPDIVVSDVMMPIKDGLELCDTIKKDTRTSHIPIILLTAKANFEAKISGLKRGADAYLTKPFEEEELLVRLEQLLLLRKNLHLRYADLTQVKAVTTNVAPHPAQKTEDQFIQKLREVILEHLSEEDFNIQNLCRTIGLGRTQLHKKLKALTGQSTSAFIRTIRLQRAQELLITTDLTVAEVGYEVGISNPHYFSRIYKEKFGQSPTNHVKS